MDNNKNRREIKFKKKTIIHPIGSGFVCTMKNSHRYILYTYVVYERRAT